jgi:SAM-dependent methyltransferase
VGAGAQKQARAPWRQAVTTFRYNGQELSYFSHAYNHAGENMRAVEVPIVLDFIDSNEWDRILEIGNVLSHYMRIDWPVLDAREKGPGMINTDLMAWQPEKPFDRIVSISTLEHIGHGRYANLTAPTMPSQALDRIRSWLAPGGEALLTVPLRYNQALDRQVINGELKVDDLRFMRRVSADNDWTECSLKEAMKAQRPTGYRWPVAMAALYCIQDGSMKTLNLGAGRRPIKGAVNHDICLDLQRPWITVAHNLSQLPWPWEDNSFDRIVARAVLEHIDIDLVASLNECWRILRPKGILYVKLPFWNSDIAHADPTHRWFFSLRSFDQFDPNRRRGQEYDFYTDRHWRIIKGPRLNDAKSSIHVTMEVRK